MSRPLELVMARQWVALLTSPVLLFDATGSLAFFNEAASVIMGRSFNECGALKPGEWHAMFRIENSSGGLVPQGSSSLDEALSADGARLLTLMLRGLDGQRRQVSLTTFPIRGLDRGKVGVMALVEQVG